MSKDDFISGSILEFKLPTNLGYAYGKVLDFRYIREFDGVLVKVFDHIVKEPIDDFMILAGKDWLFGARRMPWLPGTRGKGAWKIKGVLVAQDDSLIPDFKYCIKSSPFVEDESILEPWNVVRNINECIPAEYEKVKHLEDTVVSPRPAIEIRTAMEYYRKQSVKIMEYFDLSITVNELIYKQMKKVPIYSSIPKEIRGKALSD
jgi:hypothetical protein